MRKRNERDESLKTSILKLWMLWRKIKEQDLCSMIFFILTSFPSSMCIDLLKPRAVLDSYNVWKNQSEQYFDSYNVWKNQSEQYLGSYNVWRVAKCHGYGRYICVEILGQTFWSTMKACVSPKKYVFHHVIMCITMEICVSPCNHVFHHVSVQCHSCFVSDPQ